MREVMALRVGDDERATLKAAAASAGLPTSTWMRRVLNDRARRALRELEAKKEKDGEATPSDSGS